MGWETQPLRVMIVRFHRFLIRVICVIRDSDNHCLAGAVLVHWDWVSLSLYPTYDLLTFVGARLPRRWVGRPNPYGL